jgi:hypothetical protein
MPTSALPTSTHRTHTSKPGFSFCVLDKHQEICHKPYQPMSTPNLIKHKARKLRLGQVQVLRSSPVLEVTGRLLLVLLVQMAGVRDLVTSIPNHSRRTRMNTVESR